MLILLFDLQWTSEYGYRKLSDLLCMEKEINDLSQKMDEIVKNSGMITVRIFFADK